MFEYSSNSSGKAVNLPDPCLAASHRLHEALKRLVCEIEDFGDASIAPSEPLPVDKFLADMEKRKNAPRVTYKPRRLKDEIWTESTTAYLYAGIEAAFVKAGRIPGENYPGYANGIRELRAWVLDQINDPARPLPKLFAAKTARYFATGFLEERRPQRVPILHSIAGNYPSDDGHLQILLNCLDQDLADQRLLRSGRPNHYQKIVFAAEIANLWNTLTSKPYAKDTKTNFARFLCSCWQSGQVERQLNVSFKRVLRYHIEEDPDPSPCGSCPTCIKTGVCKRRRYYGRLI